MTPADGYLSVFGGCTAHQGVEGKHPNWSVKITDFNSEHKTEIG